MMKIIYVVLVALVIPHLYFAILRFTVLKFAQCVQKMTAVILALAHLLFVAHKRKQIAQLYEELFALINEKYKCQLKRFSQQALIALMVSALATMGSILYGAKDGFVNHVQTAMHTKEVRYYHWFTYAHYLAYYGPFVEYQFLTLQLAFYRFAVLSWSYAEKSFIESLYQQPLVDNITYVTMIRKKLKLNSLRQRIDSVFGVVVLSWFAAIFIQTTGFMSNLGSMEAAGVFRIFTYFRDILFLFTIMAFVANIQSLVSKKRKCFLQYQGQQGPISPELMIVDLKFRKLLGEEVPFSAVLFDLHSSLALGFVSSLISFTVMFLQITDRKDIGLKNSTMTN
ncbi:hypothetical protein HDE_06385 [Halotydeus destructor]|nr:hypothetical protein HDE_06385 [Halotydeus destructor]